MPEPSDGRPLFDRHQPVDFVIAALDEVVPDFVVTPSEDGRRYDIMGQCPRCGGRTSTTWITGTGTGYKGLFHTRRGSLSPADRRRSVFCECGHAHANRPDDAAFLGCGAHWYVELP